MNPEVVPTSGAARLTGWEFAGIMGVAAAIFFIFVVFAPVWIGLLFKTWDWLENKIGVGRWR